MRMYDCIIVGGGPAGYSAAIRAGQLGMRTVLIERASVGGMCLNWGCVPARGMLESAKMLRTIRSASEFGIEFSQDAGFSFSWKKAAARTKKISKQLTDTIDRLLSKYAVEVLEGTAAITGPGLVSVNNRALEARQIIIATGSRPGTLPRAVVDAAGGTDSVIELPKLFTEHRFPDNITVYGAGPVAIEVSELFALLGKKVHLLLEQEDILPGFDEVLINAVLRQLSDYSITLGKHPPAKADLVINCSLRKPVVPEMKVQCIADEDGFLAVDRWCRTSIEGIYAAGDVTGKSYLAQPASIQGATAVNHIAGIRPDEDPFFYPLTLYGVPEIAQAGMTESEIRNEKIAYTTATYSFGVNGKALAEGDTEGFVRILYEELFGEVLGVQIAGSRATDMIAEALAVIRAEGTVYDLSTIVHAHPASSELFIDAHREEHEKEQG